MASISKEQEPIQGHSTIHALIDYEDPYVQPLILAALEKRTPKDSYQLISSLDELPSRTCSTLQFVQYESIDFPHLLTHSSSSMANAYVIRKALIRKHYLSNTVSSWITKRPDSILKQHVKPSVEFEVDFAEFLDDALLEAYELHESWARNADAKPEEREYWILKPGMSERGQGIRIFSSEEELTAIFEEWDPESDDEEDEDDDARSDGDQIPVEAGAITDVEETGHREGRGIITSQLRHFIAQPYIHPPLLLPSEDPSVPLRKFHIRTYVLAVGALKVYVYKPMLALFAARSYVPPWESGNDEEGLRAHLTNTCLQDTNEREGSVSLFWDLPDKLPHQSSSTSWKDDVFKQIVATTGEVFEAAARAMTIHFQPLPNAFELFGVDFMIHQHPDTGALTTYLLEVNAFPDFRQTGDELKGVIEGLFEGVVDTAIAPFFGVETSRSQNMVEALDIDLGRR